MARDVIAKSVMLYRDACEKGDPKVVVAAYRALQPYFQKPASYGPLGAAVSAWTGKPIPTKPASDIVIKSPSLLPWTVALCSQPPWPLDLPSHAIPVSVLELVCLQQAPETARARLHEELVKAWQRGRLPWGVEKVLKWFDESQWEVILIRDSSSGAALFSSPAAPIQPTLPMEPGTSALARSEPIGSVPVPGVAAGRPLRSIGAVTTSPGPAPRAISTTKKPTIEEFRLE